MAENNWEITKHYNGEATVTFKPGAHGYWVDDPKLGHKNKRTGGGTSLTGVMTKGQALMMWPMWEMSKYLKTYFETTTIMDLVDNPDITINDLLKAGRDAHVKKSDRGKSVGTDAHAWVEQWSKNKLAAQESGKEFVEPEIPDVEDIVEVLRKAYLRVINDLKPKEMDEWKRLPKLIFKEIEIQEAIWTEARMVRQSILGAKEWLDQHKITVHGAEDTVYSRELFVCGKYDADWTVTCTEKCGWCFKNGQYMNGDDDDGKFIGRYIVDFKSTNASSESPKGIYPEYLAQCAVYHIALSEEFPDRKYDGYLILNGSKTPYVDKKTNQELPVFNTHFSFNTEEHMAWARNLAALKEQIWAANNEMKESNESITKKASSK